MSSSQFLRCVVRGRVEVRQGDWVLLEERGQQPKVGRVDQIAQVVKLSTSAAGHSVIRMWCTQCTHSAAQYMQVAYVMGNVNASQY